VLEKRPTDSILAIMHTGDWECCYMLAKNRTEAQVAALLGGQLYGPTRSECEASKLTARWPSIGPASEGWTALIDPHFEFGDFDEQLRRWSAGTQVARLMVIERELFSHATVWSDNDVEWNVSFEAELDEQPLVDDRFPYDLDALAAAIGLAGNPNTWHLVLTAALRQVTGWLPRPDRGVGPLFAELVYPRPEGVAVKARARRAI
jgi:hypothetical protein